MSDTMVNALVMFALITLVPPAQTRLCKVLAFPSSLTAIICVILRRPLWRSLRSQKVRDVTHELREQNMRTNERHGSERRGC
jgi:hypothetical protein